MFIIYAISGSSGNYIYVGMTSDLQNCLEEHQSGQNKTTKAYLPLSLFYTATFQTRQEAKERENFLKSVLGKEYLEGKLKINNGRQMQYKTT